MHIYEGKDLASIKAELIERLSAGQVGVFPTDTIYGLTVDARNFEAVERVLALKRRRSPVSCIPHSVDWARLLIHPEFRELFDREIRNYQGRFTTLWPSCPEPKLAHPLVQTDGLVGLRFPEHWILGLAQESGIPFTTTSVNRTGEDPMHSLETLPQDLHSEIDFLVYEGPLQNPPSVIVRCDTPEFEQKVRD